MAKAARHVEHDLPEREVTKFVKGIFEHYESIESHRGRFMNAAQREREAMTAIYETMAQRGVSQRAAKTEIKIMRALERIKGWMADIEADDRRMVEKLAKLQGDKRQMLLFGELDPLPKETKARKPRTTKPMLAVDNEQAEATA